MRAAARLVLAWSCVGLWVAGSTAQEPLASRLESSPKPSKLAGNGPAHAAAKPLPDDVRGRLAGRLKQPAPNTRVAALQEIADYPSVDAVQLVLLYGLRDRTPEVHAAATRALRQHQTDAQIGKYLVSQWEREATTKKRPNQEYAQRLLAAICEYRLPEVYRELLDVADRGEPTGVVEAIMAAIDKAATEQDAALLRVLEPLTASNTYDRSFGFRRCVIDAVAQLRHADAVTFLIRELRSQDGELRNALIQHLRRITRESFSADAEAWEKWWQVTHDSFAFADASPPAAGRQETDQGTPLYYDIPIHAQRLVFVLDTSRSMSAATTTTSRLDAAKRELVQVIDKLPEDTLFNVIVFNSTVARWSDRMAPATSSWKSHAIAFVRSQKPVGKTATYDALHAAFELDPHLEAIYLLSDGAPSAGAVTRPNLLLAAIHRQNRARRLTIHTIGLIGRDPDAIGLEDFMRKLAAQNYGEFRRVE